MHKWTYLNIFPMSMTFSFAMSTRIWTKRWKTMRFYDYTLHGSKTRPTRLNGLMRFNLLQKHIFVLYKKLFFGSYRHFLIDNDRCTFSMTFVCCHRLFFSWFTLFFHHFKLFDIKINQIIEQIAFIYFPSSTRVRFALLGNNPVAE